MRRAVSQGLMLASVASVLLAALIYLFAPATETSPTTLPAVATPTTQPVQNQGWTVDRSAIELVQYLPSAPELAPHFGSTLKITADGPLEMNPAIDALSAALTPGLSGWARSYSSVNAAASLWIVQYESEQLATLALEQAATVLRSSVLPSEFKSPQSLVYPPAQGLVIAKSESNSNQVTTLLRRGAYIVGCDSPTGLATALTVSASVELSKMSDATARGTQIGSTFPLSDAAPRTALIPPLSSVAPRWDLQYPLRDSGLCLLKRDGVWQIASCSFKTALPASDS